MPVRTIGIRVRAARAKKIPERKCFLLKCNINEIVMKKIATTCAKNQVVPTVVAQKKDVPRPKNRERKSEFFLEANFKSSV